LGATTPAFSGWLFYLLFAQGSASPSPLQSFGSPVLFVRCIFFSFLPGWGSVCPGGYADFSQGVPHAAYLLTWWSPKQGRSWHLAAWEPSWFLCLMWWAGGGGMVVVYATCRLGVWRCGSFASSRWFFLPGVPPASLQDFTLGSMFFGSSL
jgi:hypothetical protein